MTQPLAPKTRVHLLSFVGPTFETSWQEKGTICKPRKGWQQPVANDEWYIVKFDLDGAKLCVHRSRIMVANDQSEAA